MTALDFPAKLAEGKLPRPVAEQVAQVLRQAWDQSMTLLSCQANVTVPHMTEPQSPWQATRPLTNLQVVVAVADEPVTPIVLTYKYRLLPSKKQHAALVAILESQRQLYNGALEHRIGAYRKAGRTITLYEQQKELTQLRRDALYAMLPANIQRWTLGRLEGAYTGFFRRIKCGEKPGFPRFRAKGRWCSFGFGEFSGIRFDGNRIRFKGMPGGLRVHLHRPLPGGNPLGCVFKRDAKSWSVCFQMRLERQQVPNTGQQVGVDVGLTHLATLSTGEHIPNVRPSKRAERELRRRQRALARCIKGSNSRKKAKLRVTQLHLKVKNTRATYLHEVSARLVRENDLIAVENLNVKGLAGGMLAKSVHDAGWAKLKEMLIYKAAYAGRELIEVDPRNTSKACSGCGTIVPKKLSERWHHCPDCGLGMDRDHNAAVNILQRGRSGSRDTQLKAVARVCPKTSVCDQSQAEPLPTSTSSCR